MDLMMFRSIVENGTGFNDQRYYDDHPYMGLVECIQASATDIAMCQLELAESVQDQSAREMSAMYSYLTEGVSIDYEALAEASKANLLDKIKGFFARIKKWIQSIIAKIKINIDKRRLSGKQLYERYKDSPGLKDIKAKNLVFNGYKMEKADPFDVDLSTKTVDNLIGFMKPSDFKTKRGTEKKASDEVKGKLTAIADNKAGSRAAAMVATLTGIKVKQDGWQDDLNKKIFGEKTDLKYGTGMFSLENVKSALLSDESFQKVLKSYETLNKSVTDAETEMTKLVNDIKQGYTDAHNKEDTPEETKKYNDESDVTEYCNRYLALYQETIGVIQKVQAIRTNYHNIRMNQAKSMFVMMITGKVEKKDNNDFELDETEAFAFDF